MMVFSWLRYTTYLTLLLLIATIGCAEEDLPAGYRGAPFSLSDSARQERLIVIMKEQNIPFLVDGEGYISFLLTNQAQIHFCGDNSGIRGLRCHSDGRGTGKQVYSDTVWYNPRECCQTHRFNCYSCQALQTCRQSARPNYGLMGIQI